MGHSDLARAGILGGVFFFLGTDDVVSDVGRREAETEIWLCFKVAIAVCHDSPAAGSRSPNQRSMASMSPL